MMKVEAKDIPIMQKFMTEFWKTIKDFYGVENTDKYGSELYDRYIDLCNRYPEGLERDLLDTFYKWVDRTVRKEAEERERDAV